MRSRVIPGSLVTIERRVPVSRLNNVDLPTLGRPTITSDGSFSFIRIDRLLRRLSETPQLFWNTPVYQMGPEFKPNLRHSKESHRRFTASLLRSKAKSRLRHFRPVHYQIRHSE